MQIYIVYSDVSMLKTMVLSIKMSTNVKFGMII